LYIGHLPAMLSWILTPELSIPGGGVNWPEVFVDVA
jgi:hypothetical protein